MDNRAAPNLFSRLPGHIRSRDAEEGRPLEALFEVFANEIAIVERDLDQLYDNWFVETCEPWVLPYIAELIGATPMRDVGTDQAGLLRAYIANLLQYRQAKGTAAVVEQVARDVSGWPVVAVEFFERLAISQNVNHVLPDKVVFPSMNDSGTARKSRSPFSKILHGAAAGSPSGWSGRYNIPHLGLFVWRHRAMPVWPIQNDSGPYTGGGSALPDLLHPGLLRFDPLGRDLPLVNRPTADVSVSARMSRRTVPARLDRDDIYRAFNAARDSGATPDRWFEDLPPFRIRLGGIDVPPDRMHGCNLSQTQSGEFRRPAQAGQVFVDPELGRLSVHQDDEILGIETGYATGAAFDIGGGAYDRRESTEAWLPELVIPGEEPPWQIGVTQIAAHVTDNPDQGGPVVNSLRVAIGRWNAHAQVTQNARGIIVVMDNATYDEALTGVRRVILPPGATLAIVAGAWPISGRGAGTVQRMSGRISPMNRRPVLTGAITVDGQEAGQENGGTLIIDGLATRERIVLRAGGDLGALQLYNCTIGADGAELRSNVQCASGNARVSVLLHRCILRGVSLPSVAADLKINRCVIGEDLTADGGTPAALGLNVPAMALTVVGSTIFGNTSCHTIEAENSILLGRTVPEHRQSGCVRFCYVTPESPVPQRFRCVPRASASGNSRPVFNSTRFQDPGFAQLSERAPPDITEGAEDGMEMGVGYANRDPARRANLIDTVEEFAPFGLTPGVVFMT